MYFKVSRDPIYSEIFIHPIENLVIDTAFVQRLRYLSQLAGAEYVYPSATHTRFAHSLGVMHLSGVYAEHIYPGNHSKFRVLRLAGLLHDIGHGPYSHSFDDIVYKAMGYADGHDDFRHRIITERLAKEVIKEYKKINAEGIKKDFLNDLSLTIGEQVDESNLEYALDKLMQLILEVYKGEETGSVDFNLTQGPLGADRLDFVLRDSYYAGTRHFGTGATDRLIRSSSVDEDKKICYSIKVIDDIYSSLFARFMMYKNVYFHKTSRAADQMIQQILKIAYDVLGLKERVENLDTFVKLTDQRIMDELEFLYEITFEKNENHLGMNPDLIQKSDKLSFAHNLIERLKARDLWKLILEIPFSTTGVDPSIVSISVAQNSLNTIKEKLQKVMTQPNIPMDDKNDISYILDNFDYIFKIDTPYKLSLVHPKEFLANDVYIKDYNGDVLSFDMIYERYPALKLMESNLIQIVRIYIKEDKRELLKKYNAFPDSSKQRVNTKF